MFLSQGGNEEKKDSAPAKPRFVNNEWKFRVNHHNILYHIILCVLSLAGIILVGPRCRFSVEELAMFEGFGNRFRERIIVCSFTLDLVPKVRLFYSIRLVYVQLVGYTWCFLGMQQVKLRMDFLVAQGFEPCSLFKGGKENK